MRGTTKQERMELARSLLDEVFLPEMREYLIDTLDRYGFFTAPASTKYHGNYVGGLFDHSYEVTRALLKLTKQLHLHWERPESPYLVGLLHDLCKCDLYREKEDGTFEYVKDTLFSGHGHKSVVTAMRFVELTEEEMLCIWWHMGAYDDKENWNNLGAAIEKYPNVLYTHTADMIASRIIGI